MKCWKCGTDNTDGAGKCLYCGTTLTRTACVSEEGKALRQMYDQYGAETVLTQRGYLTNGLGDFLPDSGKLRNQLKMVLDIGVGECYLEQLQKEGQPNASFMTKIRRMIVEDAGLSDKVADSIMGYLDEMIGWPKGSPVVSSSTAAESNERQIAPAPQITTHNSDEKSQADQKKRIKAILIVIGVVLVALITLSPFWVLLSILVVAVWQLVSSVIDKKNKKGS